jgi:hypothetical protein
MGSVDLARPVTQFRGGIWSQLTADSNLSHSIKTATVAVIGRLSKALGRPATVGDIPLLGSSIRWAPLWAPSSSGLVTADTQLIDRQ